MPPQRQRPAGSVGGARLRSPLDAKKQERGGDELRARLLARPLRIALAGSSASDREKLRRELTPISDELQIVDWLPKRNPDPEPAILAWLGPGSDSEGRKTGWRK